MFGLSNVHTFKPFISLTRLILIMQNPTWGTSWTWFWTLILTQEVRKLLVSWNQGSQLGTSDFLVSGDCWLSEGWQ